jgi:hypothetical protein
MTPLSRRTAAIVRLALLFIFALAFAFPAWADSPRVISVEEHWELRLGEPDADRSAPQTTMFQSPDGDLEGVHFLFTINHATVPEYEPGGLQVQLWDSDQLLESSSAGSGALSYNDEVVTWVQRITLENDTLTFQVREGASETWGSFGGGELTLNATTSLTNLNGYRPGISITESQVSYAENRVGSLTLKKLVWTTDDGEVHELNAPIAVDTSLDP